MLDNNKDNRQNFSVMPAEYKQIEGIVQCRMKAFPDYFITKIGPGFIKASSRFYIDNQDGIIYVAENSSGRVIGVVSGGNPKLRKQFTRKCVPYLFIDVAFAAIRSGFVRKRLMQYALVFFKKILIKVKLIKPEIIDESQKEQDGVASLSLICTHPDFVGKGIGAALVETFEKQCRNKGYKEIKLSVFNNNHPAIALYTKCGFIAESNKSDGIIFKKTLSQV